MPKVVLTTKTIEHAKAPPGGRLNLWDVNIPHLCLRVTTNGVKTWVFMYRLGPRVIRLTLGRFPAMSLADARVAAGKAQEELDQGRDPSQAERIAEEMKEAEALAAQAAAVGAEAARQRSADVLLRRWLEEHVKPNNRSPSETIRMIGKEVIPVWVGRPIESITKLDAGELTTAIMTRGSPITANRVLGRIKSFFNWLVGKGIIDSSPVARMPKLAKERSRERVMTGEEIRAVWLAAPALGYPFGPFHRFLLATGQRRSETAMMKWTDINFDKAIWTIPPEDTKPERGHDVHLPPLAIKILREIQASQRALEKKRRKEGRIEEAERIRATKWVFTVDGAAHITGFSKAHLIAMKASNTSGWTTHDLRRTAASGMAELGVAPHVVSRILNHAPGQSSLGAVGAIYNRYQYKEEMKAALNAWAQKLTSLTAPVRLVSTSR